MVAVIGEMDWAPAKAGILKYIIRLSPFQNVVLMAIDMLRKKLDGIIAEIVRLEAVEHPDAEEFRKLANLYHEICFLDLSEPIMKRNYQNKACDYALKAFKTKNQSEDDALLAVKYLLESDRVGEAKKVYDHIRNVGDYFVPKWITYELELSVRLEDKELFENLYILIEAGGGVFIPDKVKEAAKAWKSVLTSAWL
jgi:hypothetical protein